MRTRMLSFATLLMVPAMAMAQVAPNNANGGNGVNNTVPNTTAYNTGWGWGAWWFWIIIIAIVVALIFWGAGSSRRRRNPPPAA